MMEAAAVSLLVAELLGGAEELPKEDVQNLERTMKPAICRCLVHLEKFLV